MRKAFKYRMYLTKGQRRILEQQLEECRWVYNETLAERKRAYEERGESLRLYDTINLLPIWKMNRPSLKDVHSLLPPEYFPACPPGISSLLSPRAASSRR